MRQSTSPDQNDHNRGSTTSPDTRRNGTKMTVRISETLCGQTTNHFSFIHTARKDFSEISSEQKS